VIGILNFLLFKVYPHAWSRARKKRHVADMLVISKLFLATHDLNKNK